MDPKYFPRPIGSIWERSIWDLGSKITKNSAPHKLAQRTNWTGCQPVEPVEENYEIFIECSLKNKETNRKNGAQFQVQLREICSKQGGLLAKITQKIVLYTYCPDEPVKPIGLTADKKYEFLPKTSLPNKESKKTNGTRFQVQKREIR